MNIKEYFDKMIRIQTNFLDFLDDEVNIDEKYQNLEYIINDFKVQENHYELKSFLYLISKVSNNHQRFDNFFNKIKTVFQMIKDNMTKNFTNAELFRIFGNNKRILLILLEENIIKIDNYFIKQIVTDKYQSAKYPQYFSPEIKSIIDEEWFPSRSSFYYENSGNRFYIIPEYNEELPEDFYEKRKIGENDDYVCKLIQKDLIEEFIIFVNKNFYSLNSNINPSIFETNSFLLNQNSISLIEYAAFYGSIQIFNYLKLNNVELTSSLWLYAVHGQDAEIINSLEENCIPDESIKKIFFEKLFVESIKCHHNDIASYIQQNFLSETKENLSNILIKCIKYYNFVFIPNEIDHNLLLYSACKSDDFVIVSTLLKEVNIDINKYISKYSDKYSDFNLEIVKHTPLYAAVKNESVEIIKILLANKNIKVNFVNKNLDKISIDEVYVEEKTALHLAVEMENIDIIKLLLTNDKINVNILYIKKDPKYEFNISEKTSLYLALENKNIEIIKLLLTNENIDVNILNIEQDFYNSKSGERLEITALYKSIMHNNIEIIKLLLTNDKLNINIMNKELFYGLYISYKDYLYSEKTALYLAVECENDEIVKLLLTNSKIDINIFNKNDNYMLNKETYRDFFIDKILERSEGRIYFNENNFHNGKGENYENTALYVAVEKRNIAIIKLFLTCDKLDANVINKIGSKKFYDESKKVQIHVKTVLHIAVEKEYIDVIRLLLNNKDISIKIKDEQGKNPIDYATNSEIKQLFENYLYQNMQTGFTAFI